MNIKRLTTIIRKNLLILCFSLSSFTLVYSQETSSWNTNSNYNANNSKPFLSQLDTSNYSGSDLQIRLWYSNGWSRINITSLLLLTNKNNVWKSSYYTFSKKIRSNDSFKIDEKKPLFLNLDSIYQELVKCNLFTIKSDSIGILLDQNGNSRWNWTDSGPTMYLIEIITPSEKRALRYPCPRYFYKHYKIEKLEDPLKIITSIMSVFGLVPC